MQKLLDFDVAIEPLSGGYRTRVASPAGEAHADFAVPFTDKDLEILVFKIVRSVGPVRRIEGEGRRLVETFGGQLFQAAFSGAVGECLGRSRRAAASKGAGLRIRLRLPPALASIPWEYLYDEEYGFVGLSPETTVVRYVEIPAPVRPLPISLPLRLLAMISAPSDGPGLQGDEEWGKLNDALHDLARRGMVEVDRLEASTLAALQRPLRLREYHVLHFIGHGGWDEGTQNSALVFEGADRKTRLVSGRDLALIIRSHRSLRLVTLNPCEGARTARDDSFGGVAQALVHQGIPAVIAMQFEISDPAALVFSQSFYQAIADVFPVDVAMVEARRAMFVDGNDVEWAAPVLYLRSPDGRVFTRGRVPEAEHAARADSERQPREEAERTAQVRPASTEVRGVIEGTLEVSSEGTGTYYVEGYGGRTREQAEREARRRAEAETESQLAQRAAQARRQAAGGMEAEQQEGTASLQPRPPSQPVVYDDLVRSAFAELVQPGRLLFNPPDQMQLGQTERVEVRLTRTLELDAELLEHLRGPGKPQVEEIPTAPLMAVTLKGDGFRITAYSDEEQSVTQDGITTWEFDVRALKRGQQRLVMCVSLRIPVPGQPLEHKSIPVREATIDVQVGAPALVAHFVSGNWQWFIGTAIAIATVLIAVLYH
jgi:CHAT domain-containing protein